MAAATPQTMTVLHLETGHVLASVSAGTRQPTVEELTGGSHLAVRLPNSQEQVLVTSDLLTAATVALDDDVLGRPLDYRVVDAVPPLAFGGPPTNLTPTTVKINAPEGTPCLSLWQVGDQLETSRDKLDANQRPGGVTPSGATHRLVAVEGVPLAYEL
jgi:hypothetical protein